MKRLDFEPKVEMPVDDIGDLALKIIKRTFKQELKNSQHVVGIKPRIRHGMPYVIVTLNRGAGNPNNVYKGNLLSMEEANLRICEGGSRVIEVPVYYTY